MKKKQFYIMNRENVLIIMFSIILASGLFYLYQNLSSFECFMESSFSTAMSDISYEFEPQGSSYSKTRVFRFTITSSKNKLEYFGMKISNETGNVLFFEKRTEPEGGSIMATVTMDENQGVIVNRFFKKKCYSEIQL